MVAAVPGFRSLHKRLRFKEGASGILGVQQAGNDPGSRATLKSSMEFGRVSIEAMLRYVGSCRAVTRVHRARRPVRVAGSDALELSITGANLLDERHVEYAPPSGRRAASLGVTPSARTGHSELQFGTWLTRIRGLTTFTRCAHS